MVIETQRLLIRPFDPADWEDLHEYLSDGQVVRYEPYGVFTADESRQEAARRSSDPAFWAVCLKDSGKLIGNLYLAGQPFDAWELGYVFNAKYQGKGYATEAASCLMDHVFSRLGARRVTAMCNPLNTASWRLMERLGMRREGHLIQNVWFKRDEHGAPVWADTYQYAILAEEWNNRTKT